MIIDQILESIVSFVDDLIKSIKSETMSIGISIILTALVPLAFNIGILAGIAFIVIAIITFILPMTKEYTNLLVADLAHIIAIIFACILLHSLISLIITAFVAIINIAYFKNNAENY